MWVWNNKSQEYTIKLAYKKYQLLSNEEDHKLFD